MERILEYAEASHQVGQEDQAALVDAPQWFAGMRTGRMPPLGQDGRPDGRNPVSMEKDPRRRRTTLATTSVAEKLTRWGCGILFLHRQQATLTDSASI